MIHHVDMSVCGTYKPVEEGVGYENAGDYS